MSPTAPDLQHVHRGDVLVFGPVEDGMVMILTAVQSTHVPWAGGVLARPCLVPWVEAYGTVDSPLVDLRSIAHRLRCKPCTVLQAVVQVRSRRTA